MAHLDSGSVRGPHAGMTAAASAHELALYRRGNWWDSKIPPILGLAYLHLALLGVPATRGIAALAALLVSAMALAGYAHVLNDWCDIDADRAAGKVNRVGALDPRRRTALLVALALGGGAPWLLVPLDAVAWGVLAIIFLVPVLYAVPPIRLKERGALGVLADATNAHAAPALFVGAELAAVAGGFSRASLTATLVTGAWALSAGIRGILLHQMHDHDEDQRAGLRTLVTGWGVARTRALVARVVFPVELGALLAAGLVLAGEMPLLLGAGLALALTDALKVKSVWREPLDPAPLRPDRYVFPHDLYESWLPLLCGALLVARAPAYLPLMVVHLWLFRGALAARARQLGHLVHPLLNLLRSTRALLRRLWRGLRARFTRVA